MIRLTPFALALLLSLASFAPVAAQGGRSYTPILIPMRDGKSLAADLYTTDTTVRKPVILVQTPYNKNFYRLALSIPAQAGGASFPYDSAHYNYVTLDWRGFFGSKDATVTGYDRGLDGYDAVEWIAAQPWCDGRVGTWGPSALGAVQFMTAKHRPPHLVCAVPLVKDFKTKYSDFYYGGVYRKEHVESLEALGLTQTSLILAYPTNDLVWMGVERGSDYPDSIAVPMLLISGWYDHFPDDILRALYDLRERSAPSVRNAHKLIMGPWMHEGIDKSAQGDLEYPNAVGEAERAALRFFDHYLRDADNGYADDPVTRYYQIGTNEWRTTDDWREVCRTADTLSLYLRSGGLLSTQAPTVGDGDRSDLPYDPRNPSPTVGGARLAPFGQDVVSGPVDLRATVESRTDVLLFSTPVLDRDIVINGGVTVRLYVSSDRTDTDFGVRLCDVLPDGRSIILTQGIRRMRFRAGFQRTDTSLIIPGAVYPVEIELQNIAATFLRGHRLRIDISSSNYPQYDVNLNNGDTLYQPGDSLPAANVIRHAPEYPSAVIFPVTAPVSDVEIDNQSIGDLSGRRGEPRGRLIGVAPNPIGTVATIRFHLDAADDVAVEVVDAVGNKALTLSRGRLPQGDHETAFDMRGMASGVYFLTLTTSAGTDRRTVVVAP